MPTSHPRALIRYVREVVLDKGHAQGSDAQLLTRFIDQRDEAAFEALMRRHGPMVLGVCRRVLGNAEDAEDAFQATFLVLVRKAASVVPRNRVGNWLYGVGYKAALKAGAASAKRRRRERQVTELPEPDAARPSHDLWSNLQPLLDQQLSRLPDKYRIPIVLCDLEGKSHQEAALQLGWPVGTLSGRLSRARALLAKRMTRRGLVVSGASLAAILAQNEAWACLPASLMGSTIKTSLVFAAGQTTRNLVPAKVAALTNGVLKAMLLTKLKSTSVLLLVASFVLAGAGTCLHVLRAEFNPSNQPEELTPVTVHERFDSTPAENSQDGEPKEQPAKETKVQSLLKERLAVLRELAEELKEQSKKGTVSPLPAMRANQQVFKAELELCETAKERVAVLEKGVETAKELEKLVASHVESGALPKGNLQSARVERLDAEIALEREKAKLSPPK